MKRAIAALFFLSGLSGLLYQVLWLRQFSVVLGSTYTAISLIVSAFMIGLLAGAWVIGKKMPNLTSPVKTYAVLEIGIGLYAVLLNGLFPYIDTLFVGLPGLWLSGPLTIMLMLPPTAAMGATLPLLVEQFTRRGWLFQSNISVFYSINALGGALGAGLAGFFFIEFLGVTSSLWLAAALNITIGLVAWRLSAQPSIDVTIKDTTQDSQESKPHTVSNNTLLWAATFTGLVALGLEIVWTRALKYLIDSSTYSFAIILVIFLTGIGWGSWWASKLKRKQSALVSLVGVLQLVIGLYSLFTIWFFYQLAYSDFVQGTLLDTIYDYAYSWQWAIVIYLIVCGLVFLIPALAMGVSFPLLNELHYQKHEHQPGQSVSKLYTVNTIGSVLGALGAGFVLIPVLGIKGSLWTFTIISLALGILFLKQSGRPLKRITIIASIGLLVLLSGVLSMPDSYLTSHEEKGADRVIFYKEGRLATVKVFERGQARNMSIDGHTIASTAKTLLQKEQMIAHLPHALRPNLKNVLCVGLASGISAGSSVIHSNVESVDCVELVEPVFSAVDYFAQWNRKIQSQPKVNLIHNDVYAYLRSHQKPYDLIISDGKLGSLNKANTTMLSLDYYELCRQRLTREGLFIQWVPIITPDNIMETVLATLKKSFPHVELFYAYPSDVFMVASAFPIPVDWRQIYQVMQQGAVQQELNGLGFQRPSELLCTYLGPYTGVGKNDIPLNTFDQPLLEFEYMKAWKKGKDYAGGYRALNLQLLLDNFEQNRTQVLRNYRGLNHPNQAIGLYNSSLNFYRFCLDNFKQGSYESGLQEFQRFKSSIPF